MGEAMLIKAGFGGGNGSGNDGTDANGIPIMPGYTTVVVTLRDSLGVPCNNANVFCNDTNQVSAYKTNEQGMTYFMVTNSRCWLAAENICNIGGYQCMLADHSSYEPTSYNTNNRGESLYININLIRINRNNGGNFFLASYLTSRIAFAATSKIGYLGLVGGGGGGLRLYPNFKNEQNAYTQIVRNLTNVLANNQAILPSGGGGGYSEARNVSVTPYTPYSLTIGRGGFSQINTTTMQISGGTGGTTAAFGYSAIGGQGPITPLIPYSTPGVGGVGNNGNGGNGNYAKFSMYRHMADYIPKLSEEFNRFPYSYSRNTSNAYLAIEL